MIVRLVVNAHHWNAKVPRYAIQGTQGTPSCRQIAGNTSSRAREEEQRTKEAMLRHSRIPSGYHDCGSE